MFKKSNLNTTLILIALLGLFSGISVFAQEATVDASALNIFPGLTNINDLIKNITTFLLGLAPILAALVLMWGGFQYFLGGFDQKSSGRKAITAAVVGFALILSINVIISLIEGTFTANGFSNVKLIAFFESIANNGFLPLASVFAVLTIMWGGYQYFLGSFDSKAKGRETITNGIIGLVVVLIAFPVRNLIAAIFKGNDNTSAVFKIDSNPLIKFLFQFINNFLLPLSSVVTVILFIIGGYLMITSAGDKSRYEKGLGTVRNAVIGLIVVLLSFTLTQLVLFVTPILLK
jgi:Type IV secretion system pilin